MKKVILLIALTFGVLQAQNIVQFNNKVQTDTVVKYDASSVKEATDSKPNYPNDDIYPSK